METKFIIIYCMPVCVCVCTSAACMHVTSCTSQTHSTLFQIQLSVVIVVVADIVIVADVVVVDSFA